MRIKSNRLLAAAIVGLLSGSTSVYATNGSFMIGFGAGSLGMGGVGVTSPQDSMCVGGNPACLGEFIQPQFDMGAGLFRPPRRASTTVMSGTPVDASGNATWQDSEVNLYLMPAMGFVWPFDDQLTVGFAALPAGGGGVTYKPNFFGNLLAHDYLGTDLVQLIVPITASYKVNETNTVGASIVPARQRFLAQGLDAFDLPGFTANPGYVTNNGHDFANGLGARIGWMGYYLDKRVTLGATWASKVYMQKFEHYKGLFAERGSFDIPANYAFGIGIKPLENLTVALDVEKIEYSDVPAYANRGPDMTKLNISATDGTLLGSPGGAGFGWKDQTVYKLGVAYKPNDNWTLRAGFNYAKMPIDKEQLLFSLLAPATPEEHYTLGFTYNMGEQSILGFGSEGLVTFAWVYARNVQLEGPTTGTGGSGYAGMAMRQQSWDLAYTLKF